MKTIPLNDKEKLTAYFSLIDEFSANFLEDGPRGKCHFIPVDVIENNDYFIIKANLPGLNKKDINISYLNDKIIIEAKEKNENNEDAIFLRNERPCGFFKRIIKLNNKCNTNDIKASLSNGVLTLKISKKIKSKAHELEIHESKE